MPLHIAIDASRTTVARVTGTEHYALQMIRALIRLNTEHRITLYFRDAPRASPRADVFPHSPLLTHKVIPFRRAWTHLRFAAELAKDRPDWAWIPAHTLPFILPRRIKAAVTVHDLGYKYFPAAHTATSRLYLDVTTRTSAARANVIFADSAATAHDLTRFYGTDAAKIRVVYPGVDAPVIGSIDAVRAKYNIPEHYFLFIGTLQPRKNIARIVAAYRAWQQLSGNRDTALVLAGAQGWLYDPAWIGDAESIIQTGYIDETDKGALYAGAKALVFPTLYEGFGFPVLEAMHCGTPVICSATSSLPELAGDAALLVDPLDVNAIRDALARVSDDAVLRQSLRAKGMAQAATFTWDRAARQVLESLV